MDIFWGMRIATIGAIALALSGCPPTGDPPEFDPLLPDVAPLVDGSIPDMRPPPIMQDAQVPDMRVPDIETPDLGPLPECVDLDGDGYVTGDNCELPGGDCDPNESTRYPGAAELCNRLDDDCDRASDEGNPGGAVECETGEPGICAEGLTTCNQGAISCEGKTRPGLEACNHLDDDCDGQVDEDNPGGGDECETNAEGACRPGIELCTDGETHCVSHVDPVEETCDGIDEDCDGQVDEENPDGGAVCETGLDGVCTVGVEQCAEGAITCAQTVMPQDETCNGLDDDCDGQIDETYNRLGDPCEVGVGACLRDSLLVCNEAGNDVACDTSAGDGTPELCNGLDDNCNDQIDDTFNIGEPCEVGVGACANAGIIACAGEASSACDAEAGLAIDELCNAIDDDCDGETDEAFPMLGEDCVNDEGACPSPGVWICDQQDGGITCSAEPIMPHDETCNGIDDDCDGQIDEIFTGLGDPCTVGIGLCERVGIQECAEDGSEVVCSVEPGPNAPELCDGQDNDCDGRIDNRAECPGPLTARITTLRIAEFDEAGCADLNGDDGADNALGAVAGLFNPHLQADFNAHQRGLFVQIDGLSQAEGPFVAGILEGIGDPSTPSPRTLAGSGMPLELIPGISADEDTLATEDSSGILRVPSPLFYDPSRSYEDVAFLHLTRAGLDGAFDLGGDGLRLNGVALTGIISRDALLTAYATAESRCAEEDSPAGCAIFDRVDAELLGANIQADIDTDGDGIEDALSVCLILGAEGVDPLEIPPIGGQACEADSDCYAAQACRAMAITQDPMLGAALGERCGVVFGGALDDEPCQDDADCLHGLCVAATAVGGRCTRLCEGDASCAAGSVCRGVQVDVRGALTPGGRTAPVCVPVVGSGLPCTRTCEDDEICASWLSGELATPGGTIHADGRCQIPDPAGAALGEICETPYDCVRGNGCVTDDGVLRCAPLCDGPRTCDEGTVCQDQDRVVPQPFCVPVPAIEGSATLCTSDLDCPAQETCGGHWIDSIGIAERYCTTGSGFFAVGQPCAQGSDCASDVCVGGLCSGSCAADADCGPRLACAGDDLTDDEGHVLAQLCAPATEGCVFNSDCDADPACQSGQCVCDNQACRVGCIFPGVCPGGLYCQPDGLCAPFCRDDDTEPNDTLATATRLPIGRAEPSVTLRRQLCATSSVDWYQFDTGGLPFSARITPIDEDAIIEVALNSPFGQTIATGEPGEMPGELTLQIEGEDPNRTLLFLQVRGAGIHGATDYIIHLEITQPDCPDPADEPQDRADQWTEMAATPGDIAAQMVSGWICPQDEDWYTVWLDGGDELTVTLTNHGNDGRARNLENIELAFLGPDHPSLPIHHVLDALPLGGQMEYTAPPTRCSDDANPSNRRCLWDGQRTDMFCVDDSYCYGFPYFIRIRGGGSLDRAAYDLDVQVVRETPVLCVPDPYEQNDLFDVLIPRQTAALDPAWVSSAVYGNRRLSDLPLDTDIRFQPMRSCGNDGPRLQAADTDRFMTPLRLGERIKARIEHLGPVAPMNLDFFQVEGGNVLQSNAVNRPGQIEITTVPAPAQGFYALIALRGGSQGVPGYLYDVPYQLWLRRISADAVDDPACDAPQRINLVGGVALQGGTTAGSNDDHRPLNCIGGAGPDRVFVVRLPAGVGTFTARVVATGDDGYDPAVSIREVCAQDITELACNEDRGEALDPYLEAQVIMPFNGGAAGRDVFVVVDSYDRDHVGAFSLELTHRPE